MWPFTKRKSQQVPRYVEEAWEQLRKDHNGKVLDSLPTNADRARQCLTWCSEQRNRFYQGRNETIADMLLSQDLRYRHMTEAERRAVGDMKWGSSKQAKEIVGMEQMYARWASMYLSAVGKVD